MSRRSTRSRDAEPAQRSHGGVGCPDAGRRRRQENRRGLVAAGIEILRRVSCARATFCVAVGFGESSAGGDIVTLALRWEAGQWTLDETPPISGTTESFFVGVSCSGRRSCFAVGWASDNVETKPIVGSYE